MLFRLSKMLELTMVSVYVKATKNIVENKLNHKLFIVSVNINNVAHWCTSCVNAQPAVTSYVRHTGS